MLDMIARVLVLANKVKIASLGGIEAIIKVMSTHKENSEVQEKACCALLNLAVNDGICISLFVIFFTRLGVFFSYLALLLFF